ncbi:MAG: HAD family hydrolase [Candidatus Bathyarchaeota archaeon]|nr:HAD family hydrolase [Candidatus Bathyarchaeota archaeon]
MPAIKLNGHKYEAELILFDVDGTLVDDTHRYSSLGKARYNSFQKHASTKAAEEWARLAGVNPKDWSIDPLGPISKAPRRDDLAIAAGALYLDGYHWYDARALAEKIYESADEEQKKSFKPQLYDGTFEKLVELKKAGFKLGIATNGVTKITEEMLAGLGLGDVFSMVVGADLVDRSKPAPDMILLACEKMGSSPKDTMYVGDQYTDMAAANDAGALSVGVRNLDLAEKGAKETISLVKDIVVG